MLKHLLRSSAAELVDTLSVEWKRGVPTLMHKIRWVTNPPHTSGSQATHQTASLSVMDDDDEWDTDPDHVAPPDSKGTGAGQRAIDNPFDQNRRHSQEITAQKQQTATVAAREAPKVVKKACLLYTSPSPRDQRGSRMPSSA